MVSYENLRILLVRRNLEWKDLIKKNVISQYTRRNLADDNYVDLSTLETLARYLNVDIGDLVSIKKD